jgi:hypothetical protein
MWSSAIWEYNKLYDTRCIMKLCLGELDIVLRGLGQVPASLKKGYRSNKTTEL